ncbi:MAG TPA: DUF2786 domain-containing protein [Acidimicrobiales bacterium]|nr:DUF2786 domain-containing protein [Acidimicrobiales bacterium]
MTSTEETFEQARAKLVERVRMLLAHAEDPSITAEEAQAYTAKAQQLMTKYAIDLAMITDVERRDRVVQRDWIIEAPYAAHKVSLVNAVARTNDCAAIYTDLAGGHKRIDVVGYPEDVEWVQTLYSSLVVQLTGALGAARRLKPPGVHGRTFAVGFAEGFVHEISDRLKAARRAAVAAAEVERSGPGAPSPGGPSVALVLVAKKQRVDDEYRVRFPGARSVHRYTRLSSWSGYQPGRDAGRRASLARGAVRTRRALSA